MARILRTDFLSAAIRTTPPHFFRSDCPGSHLRLAELFSSVMMRKLISALPFLIATAAFAQQNNAQKVVAVVNGETITAQKLDQLYARMGAQMRKQYEKAGGKMAFLDNYIKKRLLIQEA